MNRFQIRFFTVDGVEKAHRIGIEEPDALVHDRQRNGVVVLKFPGHQYWSGRNEQSYAPAEFLVIKPDKNSFYELVASFPVRKAN